MKPLSSYLQYETNVIKLLKDRIKSETGDVKNLIANYQYKGYVFDLVELDDRSNLSKVYEIKTLSALIRNFYSIVYLLQRYADATKAEVFLVFMDNNQTLQIVSLSDLIKYRYPYELVSIKQPKKEEYQIRSLSEFSQTIKKMFNNKQDEYTGTQFFFRGHSNVGFDSVPSIFRDKGIVHEQQMYHDAIRRNPSIFTEDMSTFDKLVKMQHYELPTRLLDITTNPLVALYFACQPHIDKNGKETDGAVLVFSMIDEDIMYYDKVPVCILSNLAKCSNSFSFTKNKKELVFYIQQDIHNYQGADLRSKDLDNVYCVLPKLNNERIIRQHGAFFLFGKGRSKNTPAKLQDKPTIIRIKANSKKSILKELQVFGIEEATLFPETEKIMKQIKSQYIK